MKRVKEREDALKKELSEGRREVERVLKSEARSQAKLAEVEEAFRESTLALENAQGDIESLRSELDVSFQPLIAHISSHQDLAEPKWHSG
jgi:chromosome segregation ATPase